MRLVNMRKNWIHLIAFNVLLGFVFLPLATFSASPLLDKAKSNLKNASEVIDFEIDSASDLEKVIRNGITTTLSVLGVIAVLLIIYAGGQWLTAAGSEDKIKSSKQIIRSVIIGVLIAGFAYAIVTFVIGLILS